MADCPKLSRREIERTLVETILVKIMKITNRFAISVFPYSEMPYPVHELGTNSRTVITSSNFK